MTIEQNGTTTTREPSLVEWQRLDGDTSFPLVQHYLDMWYSAKERGWRSPDFDQLVKLTFRRHGIVKQYTGQCCAVDVSHQVANDQDDPIVQVYERWLVTAV